jgi:ATP-binding cassette subfamily B protein
MSQRATASGARIFELLDRAPRIVPAPDAGPLPAGSGRVELRNASLTYEGAQEPALHDVTLTVAAGTTLALVGPTGSGKTSLVQLVSRLYDATAGEVRVDGADVRGVDPRALRGEIAVVTDDPFLFSTSVHENIAYARADATREEVVAAARGAQAHDFIEALPDGYDTLVGERGLTLSDPRILILDDATSSVDASTEQQIKRALTEVMAGRTTFVIAHRLSTITLADEIAVLEHGKLLDQGTHEELLERSPFYAEIVEKGLPDQVFLTRKPRERQVAGL